MRPTVQLPALHHPPLRVEAHHDRAHQLRDLLQGLRDQKLLHVSRQQSSQVGHPALGRPVLRSNESSGSILRSHGSTRPNHKLRFRKVLETIYRFYLTVENVCQFFGVVRMWPLYDDVVKLLQSIKKIMFKFLSLCKRLGFPTMLFYVFFVTESKKQKKGP